MYAIQIDIPADFSEKNTQNLQRARQIVSEARFAEVNGEWMRRWIEGNRRAKFSWWAITLYGLVLKFIHSTLCLPLVTLVAILIQNIFPDAGLRLIAAILVFYLIIIIVIICGRISIESFRENVMHSCMRQICIEAMLDVAGLRQKDTPPPYTY